MRKIMAEIGKSKYISWVLNFVAVMVTVMFSVFVYWSIADYKILEENEGNYQLEKLVYNNGDTLEIPLRICKNLSFKEDVYGRFIDGVIFSVPENSSNFEVGCYDTSIISVRIPDTLPSGTYVYEEQISYDVNPFRVVTYTFRTQEFEVL